jgi:hypothetical protein
VAAAASFLIKILIMTNGANLLTNICFPNRDEVVLVWHYLVYVTTDGGRSFHNIGAEMQPIG